LSGREQRVREGAHVGNTSATFPGINPNSNDFSLPFDVSTAFQQTEDFLASVRWLGEQRQEQQNSIAAAQRYYNLSLIRYKTGVNTYLNVFTAQTSLLSNQQTAITLQVQQMTSSVQLVEALGGGWDTSQLPSEKAVARK
jgi:outer membrane protein TolC